MEWSFQFISYVGCVDCKIDENGAELIAEALKINLGVQELSLSGTHCNRKFHEISCPKKIQTIENNIGARGSKYLAECLLVNKTLHTLLLYGMLFLVNFINSGVIL